MGKLLANQIRGINPLAKKGVLLLWAFLLSFACVFGSHEANAAPTTTGGNAWTSLHAATAAALTVNVTSTTALTPGTGANRLLLVVVHMEKAAGTTTPVTLDAQPTFGGVPLVTVADNFSVNTAGRALTWMGYLPDGLIPAGAGNVVFQATSPLGNFSGIQIKAAVYTGVDQSTPISAAVANYAASATLALPTGGLSYVADSISVFATCNGGTPATTTFSTTGGSAFALATGASSTAGAMSGYVAVSGTNATAGTYTTATNVVYGGTTSTRSALVAASLKPWVASTDVTKPIVTSFVAPSSATSTTITGITMTATDNVAVTGYGITESSTPPLPSLLTSATPVTSYTASSAGTKTLYAWAKDAAGNVSNVFTAQSCTITLPPKPTRAANWTSQYGAVAYPAGTVSNYTMTAGSNRLLVVVIAATSTAVGAQSVTNVTWGGKPLTLAAGNGTLNTIWNHSYIYYLKEADIASASGTALTATITGGTGYYTRIYAAVYAGVDQTNPISSAALYENATANTTVGPFNPALAVGAQEQAIQIVNLARSTVGTTGRTISTWATGWTTAGQAPTGIVTSGPCQQVYIRDRAVPTSSVADGSQHTASGNTFDSYAAISIKAAASGLTIGTGSTITSKNVYAGDTSVAVDAFNVTAAAADTITSITVTGSATTTSANVSAVRVYRKVGADNTTYQAGDLLVASGTFTGNTATMTPSGNNTFTAGSAVNFIVVYDIANGAATNVTVTGNVTAMTATSISSLVDPLTESGTLTIRATTTIGNGAAEPTYARLYKSSVVMLDAFTLKHNGSATDDDTISNVTVTLTPAGISGSGPSLSKIGKIEVVNQAGTVVYGSLTAATTGDTWNISTPTLIATNAETNYYLRITTSANIVPGYYSVSGIITSVVHSKALSRLVNLDTTSQTHNIDTELPTGPTIFSATTPPDASLPTGGGRINLTWNAASDPNAGTLHATLPYIVKRSIAGGVDPAPYCTDGTTAFEGNALAYNDSGLNDTSGPIYHYRVCARDAQGNISIGATAAASSSYTNYCDMVPGLTLGDEDPLKPGTILDQLVKSEGGNPFLLQVINNDIGTCPNVDFNIALVETSTTGGGSDTTPPSVDDFITTFPATVTLGKTAGPGGTNRTSATVSIFINAHETVEQIQKFIFKAQVSAAGHGTATSPFATAILNDMPPIVHNSNNMAKFQYGTWGNEYTCATCHSNSTTNIKGVFDIISTPIGKRNVLFKRMSGNAQVTDALSNDLRTNKDGSNNVCSVCHHRTRQHQYSASKAFGGPENDAPYTTDHYNNHDCVRCHTHNTAFRSILGVCGDCHGYKGTDFSPVSKITMVKVQTNALGTSPPSYGAHLAHNYAEMACAVCHSNTNHGLTSHTDWLGDDKLEIGFNVSNTTYPGFNAATPVVSGTFEGTTNLNFPYTWVAGPGTTIKQVPDYNASCNTYCHGGWSGNVGSNIKPNWVGTGQAGCGTCHNATIDAPPSSGSHTLHAGGGATGLAKDCKLCHGTYTQDQYTGAKHINGDVQWDLSAISAVAKYNGLPAGSTGALATDNSANYATCTNMYCHSNVQGPDGYGAPTTYSEPLWGDNGEDSTTVQCNSCHTYPNTVGGHAQHTSSAEGVDFDCHVCHQNGGRTSPVNHANQKIDFAFSGLGENTIYSKGNSVTPGLGYGSCSSSNCHGSYTRIWSPATSLAFCDKCHGSATSPRGFYDTTGPDGTLSIYSSGVGLHDIHIQNPNSPRKATFSRFTSFAAGMSCKQCHYNPDGPFSPGHISDALPAEVPFGHISSIANHGDAFGYYSTPTYSFVTQSCSSVWCHGSGMQSNTAKGAYAGKTPYKPFAPKWNETMLASGNPCTKCHAMPPAASSSSDAHWNVSANRPFILTECVGCHQHLNTSATGFENKALHINGVIDGGCTGCHGDPPVTSGIGTKDGLATPAQNALFFPDSNIPAGAHQAHLNNTNIQKNCYTCHDNYNPVMISDGTGKLEIGFNAFNGKVKGGTFYGYTNSVNGPKWLKSNAETTITKVNGTGGLQTANVCANLYCHGSTIVDTATATLNKTPNWELADQAICGTCHGGDPSAVPFPAQTGAHTRHASNSGLGLACETCHGQSAANMAHVNGVVSWDLDPANPKVGATATYKGAVSGNTGALAPSASYGTCVNFYCHSNVQGAGGIGAPTAYYTMTWGTGSALTCNSCHKSQVGAGNGTASHVAHTALYGGALSCGYCHHEGGDSTDLHADGMIYVNITTSKLGTGVYTGSNRVAGSAAGYGSCSNVICHGAATLTWGANLGTVQCQKCHGSKSAPFATVSSAQVAPGYGSDGIATDGTTAATARRVGAHQRHLVSSAISSPIKCSECHVKVMNVLDNGHLNYTTATLTFTSNRGGGGSASRNASGVITCATTWCHTGKYDTGTASVTWTDTTYVNETGTTVAACSSACHAIPPAISAHSTVPAVNSTDALSTLTAKCQSCHDNIASSITNVSTAFVDKSKHINGSIEGGSCTGCHSAALPEVSPKRIAATAQFSMQSHHVQGANVTDTHCAKCHWEANSDGSVNATYHDKASGKPVDLVIWTGTSRPAGTTYTEGSTGTAYTANGSRVEIKKINNHCLGCHNTTNTNTAPFVAGSTPGRYSPEPFLPVPKTASSIQSRYSSTRTVAWSMYNFSTASKFGTNRKNRVTKAFSAHGNASKNQMPTWDAATGDDTNKPDYTYTGTGTNRNVFCFDCHNSHGSAASGITSAYSSATGRNKGGLLKSTQAGLGGYAVTYTPATRTVTYTNYSGIGQATATTKVATFNPGASICNDCHNNDIRKVNINKPWSITGTYSSTKAIVGYWSTPYFDNYTVGSVMRSPYKGQGTGNRVRIKPMGGHYGSSIPSRSASHSGEINGICTPCHDPHGVSKSALSTTDQAYAVPLLKGTWVTSPYKEDKADIAVKRGGGSWAGITAGGAIPGYHIDQNTLVAQPAPVNGGAAATTAKTNARAESFAAFTNSANGQQTLAVAQFAGLCTGCHSQASLTNAAAPAASNWRSPQRIHQSVKGWAAASGINAGNVVHAYTCSKCHAPHVSRLPRLLVTNCLDVNHYKKVATGGSINSGTPTTATSGNLWQSTANSGKGAGRFPGGGTAYIATVSGQNQNIGPWWFAPTPRTTTGTRVDNSTANYGSNCHNATNAGGAAYNPVNQKWNNKSPW